MKGVESAGGEIRLELAFFPGVCTCLPYLFFHIRAGGSTVPSLNILALLTSLPRSPAQLIGITVILPGSLLVPAEKLSQELKPSRDLTRGHSSSAQPSRTHAPFTA